MTLKVEIQNQQKRIPVNLPQITKSVRKILTNEGVEKAHLSLVFVTNCGIRILNKKFLGHDYATDVLAFDLTDGEISRQRGRKKFCQIEGEIIISAMKASENARKFETSPQEELVLYVVHGILHLLGYDDHRQSDIKRMRKKEQEVMAYIKQ